MGVTRALVSCLLIAVASMVHVQAQVQGPRRVGPNYLDCPPGMNRPIGLPQPPSSRPCPPGTHPRYPPPHGIPSLPPTCPPWVDEEGACHVEDDVIPMELCRAEYGDRRYRSWQSNRLLARRTSPPFFPEPPGPQTICVAD